MFKRNITNRPFIYYERFSNEALEAFRESPYPISFTIIHRNFLFCYCYIGCFEKNNFLLKHDVEK